MITQANNKQLLPGVGASQKQRTQARPQVWLAYLLAIGAYALIFGVWQVAPLPLAVHAASVSLAGVCMFPLAYWYASGSKGLPMFELVCLAYMAQFSAPLYVQANQALIHNQAVPLTWEEVSGALWTATLGLCALIGGYYAVQRSRWGHNLPQIDLPLDPRRRGLCIGGAILFGLFITGLQATNRLDTGGSLGAIVRVLSNQLYVGIILLAYQAYRPPPTALLDCMKLPLSSVVRRPSSVVRRPLLYLSAGLAVLLGLSAGLLENALIPLVLVFIVKWHVTRRVPWHFLIGGFLLFALLNPIKNEYRNTAWYGKEGGLGITERITLWGDLASNVIGDLMSGDLLAGSGQVLSQSAFRFDLLHKFAYVQRLTPSVVPYYGGSSYNYLLYGWIPRAIWPDKPEATNNGHQTDVDYGFLLPEQTLTANIGIGQLPEAYANFGVPGVVIVMLLEGMAFAMLSRVLNGPASEGGRAIYMSLMVFFLNGIGTSAVIFFGALFQNALANVLIARFFSTGFTRKATDAKAMYE